MIKLIGQCSLEFEAFFDCSEEIVLLSRHKREHPVSKIVHNSVGEMNQFDLYLADKYEGSLELFWSHLRDGPNPINLVCDNWVYMKLIFQLYKSVLKHNRE